MVYQAGKEHGSPELRRNSAPECAAASSSGGASIHQGEDGEVGTTQMREARCPDAPRCSWRTLPVPLSGQHADRTVCFTPSCCTSANIDHRRPPAAPPHASNTQHSTASISLLPVDRSHGDFGSDDTSSQDRAALVSLGQSMQLARWCGEAGEGAGCWAEQLASARMCDAQGQEPQQARVGARLRASILRHRARTWSDAFGVYASLGSGPSRQMSPPHLLPPSA